MVFHIKKIAIIGGGPSGLSTLNELLHTSASGESTIVSPTVKNDLPKEPAFDEIVVFEQNSSIGGVWNQSSNQDPDFPVGVKEYNKPKPIQENLKVPTFEQLLDTDVSHNIKVPFDGDTGLLWKNSALYDHLFTNIPNNLMRFSSGFDIELTNPDPVSKLYAPFVTHDDVYSYVKEYADLADLNKHVRLNSFVRKVFKKDNVWYVVVANLLPGSISWYMEKFDAVIVANGKFNVPFFPKTVGLPEFIAAHPGVISHSKSFRSTGPLRGKKVLLVGSSISAVDLLQYLVPECQEVHISGNAANTEAFKGRNEWTDKILSDDSVKVIKHVRVQKYVGDIVKFVDGSEDYGYDKIIYCTGYHIHFPFLDIPENEGKGYVNVSAGIDGEDNCAQAKIDNVYLYTFTIADPTLAHVGIAHNPLFFLCAEANAVAIAGIWSNAAELPPTTEQRSWIQGRFENKKSGFQVYTESSIRGLISKLYEFSAKGRYNFLPLIKDEEVKKAKDTLSDLFYQFASGALDEDKIYS